MFIWNSILFFISTLIISMSFNLYCISENMIILLRVTIVHKHKLRFLNNETSISLINHCSPCCHPKLLINDLVSCCKERQFSFMFILSDHSICHGITFACLLPYSMIIGGYFITLQWRHNGRDSISNHQPHDCLLKRLFGRRSKKTSKLRATGLCAGNSPVTGEFPTQRASNAENVSIWWRHHDHRRRHDVDAVFPIECAHSFVVLCFIVVMIWVLNVYLPIVSVIPSLALGHSYDSKAWNSLTMREENVKPRSSKVPGPGNQM